LEQIARLHGSWEDGVRGRSPALSQILCKDQIEALDLFDRLQLEQVLGHCRHCRTLSEAGRTLFNKSRSRKKSSNDADRLGKYLARFDLDWEQIGLRLNVK
jgi:transcriptional regulatory protein RtcR